MKIAGGKFMASDKSKQLLGELLVEAGLLHMDDVREANNIARSQNLPIGKVLVMSGYISKEILTAAVEMQSRLKDSLLNYDLGIKALKLADADNITLDQALSKLHTQERAPDSTSNRLGALLLDADLLTKTDFDTAIEESKRCGLPLGRVLTNLALIPSHLVEIALNVQRMLRSGKISKDEAVKSLIETKEGKASQENPLVTSNNSQRNIFAPLIRTSSAQIPAAQSEANISGVKASNKENELLQEKTLSLHHMLRLAGFIDTNALESAIKESLEDPEIMGIILKRTGLLEEFVIDAAKECCQLIASGVVKPEQAIIALHQCQRTRSSVKECLEEFGWIEKRKIIS